MPAPNKTAAREGVPIYRNRGHSDEGRALGDAEWIARTPVLLALAAEYDAARDLWESKRTNVCFRERRQAPGMAVMGAKRTVKRVRDHRQSTIERTLVRRQLINCDKASA